MEATKPWVIGAAFSVTIAVVYLACALAVSLFPELADVFQQLGARDRSQHDPARA